MKRISPTTLLVVAAISNVCADNNFKIVGDGLVSAQQLYVASENVVYIVDKTENNPATINGHPAWASEYNLGTNTARPMDIVTNSFCAGGIVLGNGTLVNAGGNQAVGTGGQAIASGSGPYSDTDGGLSLRLLNPCTDRRCEWIDNTANYMTSRRWYATLETLADGSAIIIGGDQWGGFVNHAGQNNPTYEFFPSRGAQIPMQFLNDTLPINLYALTWLVPSGKLFMQANWQAQMFDYTNNQATPLPNITKAVKTYPASGAAAMLPLSSADNWKATILFCGGGDYKSEDWAAHSAGTTLEGIAADNKFFRNHPNSASCVKISPDDTNPSWRDDDDLPEARSMGNLIGLPDGRFFLLNGISSGVAGYDNNSFPYGTDPIYAPAYFDPSKKSGSRWSRDKVEKASLPRLYHSTASLLADGSVLTAGSNPYRDFQTNGSNLITDVPGLEVKAEWWSETRLEVFYPDYYSKTRPTPSNLPSTISYGGAYYNLTLSATDVASITSTSSVVVSLVRTGFSTHGINFGQRTVFLDTSLVKNSDGGAALFVAPLPANPNVLAPGPAYLFVVINGVPCQGKLVMVGSGNIEVQATATYPVLPNSQGFRSSSSGGNSTTTTTNESSAVSVGPSWGVVGSAMMVTLSALLSREVQSRVAAHPLVLY